MFPVDGSKFDGVVFYLHLINIFHPININIFMKGE